jgi:hypothetical protein
MQREKVLIWLEKNNPLQAQERKKWKTQDSGTISSGELERLSRATTEAKT